MRDNWICLDCLENGKRDTAQDICPRCKSSRTRCHTELNNLKIGHVDCDAFYASVEKRDNPLLRMNPVLVGGTTYRGVVTSPCYIARRFGCRSAMPIWKAKKLCPDAILIRPDIKKYQDVANKVRTLMLQITPLVEPISIDEAFLDLTGTETLHKGGAAQTLAKLALRIEKEVGITVSIGLSHNKFLSKIASNMDKPRGFSVIGVEETLEFLEHQPIEIISGVGPSLQEQLKRDGITSIGALRRQSISFLTDQYGKIGKQLWNYANGVDSRPVTPNRRRKSISAEVTLSSDVNDIKTLKPLLWSLCEKVSERTRDAGFAAQVVILKLKTSKFQTITRRRKLTHPTQIAEKIWQQAFHLLVSEVTGSEFRLIGVGLSDLCDASLADPVDLVDPNIERLLKTEETIITIRKKYGTASIKRGRGMHRTSRVKSG